MSKFRIVSTTQFEAYSLITKRSTLATRGGPMALIIGRVSSRVVVLIVMTGALRKHCTTNVVMMLTKRKWSI